MPGIRIHEGLARLNGNVTLFLKLLQDLISGYRDCAAEIQRQISSGDLDDARILAHKLRGVAANLGAHQVSEAAQTIEDRINAQQAVPTNEVQTLGVAFVSLTESVIRISDGKEAGVSVDVSSPQETLKRLHELQQLVASSDPRALDLAEQLLVGVPAESKLSKELSAAKTMLEDYNFAGAVPHLLDLERAIGASIAN